MQLGWKIKCEAGKLFIGCISSQNEWSLSASKAVLFFAFYKSSIDLFHLSLESETRLEFWSEISPKLIDLLNTMGKKKHDDCHHVVITRDIFIYPTTNI